MAGRELVTRKSLQRELIVNAATKPVAIGVAAAVAVGALVIGAAWLLAVAVVAYIALAAATLFDGDEAERVGRAAYERARGRGARRETRALPKGLAPEIDSLVKRPGSSKSVERIAGRAQVLLEYLLEQRPDEVRTRLRGLMSDAATAGDTVRARERASAALAEQLRVGELLQAEYDRFGAEMEHLIASLAVIHAQLVRMSVSSDASFQEGIARQVRDLRQRVGTVATEMGEAVDKIGDGPE